SFKRVDLERNKNVEGTGLGLAISKQIVELMGGTITVDSIYTKGSHFQVKVLQKIANADPMKYSSVASVSNTGSYDTIFEAPDAHVLIVDDNDMNRMVTRKLLRSTRVQTDVAASGAEALEKTAIMRYDVIFMDHEMPDMDGITAMRAIRSQEGGLCRNVPMIALTANAGSDMNAFYIKQGFQAYLAKPIHGSLLEATLLQFLPPELIERTEVQVDDNRVDVALSRHKQSIVVSVDSPCDLPDEMLEEYKLSLMPLYVVTEHGRFRDPEEIGSDNLFAYYETGSRAYTEAAPVEEYEAFFGKLLNTAESVIHITISSKIGKSYETACQAAESFGNVHVVDSYTISSCIGLTAIYATKLIEEGKSVEEILEALDNYSYKVITNCLITSHESPIVQNYMPAPLRAFIRAFSLDPIMKVDRRGPGLGGFKGGYVTSASDKYIKSAMKRANKRGNKDLLFLVYSGCTVDEQKRLLEAVEELSTFDQVILQKASATLAANAWLHSFGILYADE
ncbi:MAG: DegV family EDD domain-containing protein, partial [Eggerthellaceae bacterium]|nr:DegV family EDD domain-containing protein [Eggerthellaceae bacterium]